ncbi:MAG: 1,4-dihydroxy-6-naphthoate synthase [Actinobacteria bacterium]|nr:1,4-dihydroxy-6-naphthoate synthase [Actinomycetota bacterium]
MKDLELGYSPCPNDTFIFHALTHGLVEVGDVTVREVLEDVETLNRWATEARLDLTKISYHAYGHLRDEYVALRAGGAMGRGVGPLLVARDGMLDVEQATIAIPGRLTTATLLLRMLVPQEVMTVEMRYDDIEAAVAHGDVDAGLIIHESRFTYRQHGLTAVMDVGERWEEETGLPLPLGAILIRRSLGDDVAEAVNDGIRRSLEYAQQHPDESARYVAEHAQESDPEVTRAHIELYVNDFSLDVGDEGEMAVAELFARAEEQGLLPPNNAPLFAGNPP